MMILKMSKKYKKQISKISFAYIDCDLYEETKILLNFINNNISKEVLFYLMKLLGILEKVKQKSIKRILQSAQKTLYFT